MFKAHLFNSNNYLESWILSPLCSVINKTLPWTGEFSLRKDFCNDLKLAVTVSLLSLLFNFVVCYVKLFKLLWDLAGCLAQTVVIYSYSTADHCLMLYTY